jgi:UDP:flavonoid glycosyltransferase YjiC (YdhE family)
VLFVAENISLAQVVRLKVLASSLDPKQYEIHFASSHFDEMIFRGTPFRRHALYSLDRAEALRNLERRGRMYEVEVLARYVADEHALFAAVRPHFVIGDLRLSLCVSAPHMGVPYASLINAYWSRHMVRPSFPLPDHALVSLLGERLVSRKFMKVLPMVLRHFAAPVNQLRRLYSLPPLGDLIDVLLAGDRVLFPDVPFLTPLDAPPAHHHFLGPVLWSPSEPVPEFWDHPHLDRGSLYVTLGSSGRIDRLDTVIGGLSKLGLPLMVATAGRGTSNAKGRSQTAASNIFTADFLPGAEAARRARFVVCNGGSSTAYQALAEGRPVLGIASNLDQYLAMSAIEARGAGILLRAGSLTPQAVEEAGRKLLSDPRYTERAQFVGRALNSFDSSARFQSMMSSLLGQEGLALAASV